MHLNRLYARLMVWNLACRDLICVPTDIATGMMDNTNRPHLQTTVQSRLVIKSNPDERVLSVPLPHNLIDK